LASAGIEIRWAPAATSPHHPHAHTTTTHHQPQPRSASRDPLSSSSTKRPTAADRLGRVRRPGGARCGSQRAPNYHPTGPNAGQASWQL